MSKNRNLAWWVATWFGSGASPKAPGTVGTLAALPFAWIIHTQLGAAALMASAVLLFFIGIWASNRYMADQGGDHDPGAIVVDEVAGIWLLLSFIFPGVLSYALGFILFRLFDILKPWPISYFDRTVHGGFGVMLDDILAAFYPLVLVVALLFIAPETTRDLLLVLAGDAMGNLPAATPELDPTHVP